MMVLIRVVVLNIPFSTTRTRPRASTTNTTRNTTTASTTVCDVGGDVNARKSDYSLLTRGVTAAPVEKGDDGDGDGDDSEERGEAVATPYLPMPSKLRR